MSPKTKIVIGVIVAVIVYHYAIQSQAKGKKK